MSKTEKTTEWAYLPSSERLPFQTLSSRDGETSRTALKISLVAIWLMYNFFPSCRLDNYNLNGIHRLARSLM